MLQSDTEQTKVNYSNLYREWESIPLYFGDPINLGHKQKAISFVNRACQNKYKPWVPIGFTTKYFQSMCPKVKKDQPIFFGRPRKCWEKFDA